MILTLIAGAGAVLQVYAAGGIVRLQADRRQRAVCRHRPRQPRRL